MHDTMKFGVASHQYQRHHKTLQPTLANNKPMKRSSQNKNHISRMDSKPGKYKQQNVCCSLLLLKVICAARVEILCNMQLTTNATQLIATMKWMDTFILGTGNESGLSKSDTTCSPSAKVCSATKEEQTTSQFLMWSSFPPVTPRRM